MPSSRPSRAAWAWGCDQPLRLVAEATTALRIYSSDRAAAPRTPRKQG